MLARMSLLLLATLTSLEAQTPPRTNITPAPPALEIPTVSLCALLSKPADYHGKEVRVRAQYHIGFEYSYFADPSCKDYAAATTPFWYDDVVWVELDKSAEAKTEPEIYSDFRRSASICCPDRWRDTEVELLVVGKFSKADYQGDASDKGYGHSGRHALRLVVSRIETVGASERK